MSLVIPIVYLQVETMKLVSLTSLLAVCLLVLVHESSAAEVNEKFVSSDWSDELEGEEEGEEHVRVERSPGWRRRFRVRIRRPIRKIGRAVRRTVRKVGQGVRNVARKVKSGVKKLAAKTKAAIKKAGSKLRNVAKKAKERVKSAAKKIKSHAKKIVKAPGNLAKKIRDKLASLIKKDKGEEEEEEVTKPVTVPVPVPTKPPKPVCNYACQFVKNAMKEAEFFKQSFCAFYTVKRQHRDFLIDRNFNTTLDYLINDVSKESLNFYTTLVEVLRSENPKIRVESRQKVSYDCARGGMMECGSSGLNKDLLALKCLKPCSGFSGCNQSDRNLQRAVDQAYDAFDKAVKRTLKLLEA